MRRLYQRYRNSYLSYFLMYHFFFLAWALLGSLLSVYLLGLGFRPSQVSLVVSVAFFASMLAQPVIGYLNDRFNTKRVTLALFALTLLGGYGLVVSRSFWGILLANAATNLIITSVNPVMEKLATSAPYSYGKIRIWGTIGYAMGSQIAGFLYDWIAPQAMFVALMVSMLLAIIGVVGIRSERPEVKTATDEIPEAPRLRDLLGNKTYLLYMLLAVLIASVMNIGHTYIPAMLEHSGLSVQAAAGVVSFAVLCEGPLTYFSYLFMDRFQSKYLLLVSMCLVTVQCFVYVLPVPIVLTIVVTLLTKHTAGILYIMVNTKIVHSLVPRQMLITALALVQTGRNLGSILFQHVSGRILDHAPYSQLFLVLFGVSLLTMLATLFIKLPAGTDTALYSKN